MSERNLYVIELNIEVWRERSFKGQNPGTKGTETCLYVGETYLTPEERYRKHVDGAKNKWGYSISNKLVREYHQKLRPDLYANLNPVPHWEAKEAEQRLASRLRSEGYAVYSGYRGPDSWD